MLNPMTNPVTPRWASRAETASHLGVSTRTVSRMTAAGDITAYPIGGGVVRYNLAEIDAAALASAFTIDATEPAETTIDAAAIDDAVEEGAPHVYLSNACRHGMHGACGGVRPRATCGYCSAACACTCHGGA